MWPRPYMWHSQRGALGRPRPAPWMGWLGCGAALRAEAPTESAPAALRLQRPGSAAGLLQSFRGSGLCRKGTFCPLPWGGRLPGFPVGSWESAPRLCAGAALVAPAASGWPGGWLANAGSGPGRPSPGLHRSAGRGQVLRFRVLRSPCGQHRGQRPRTTDKTAPLEGRWPRERGGPVPEPKGGHVPMPSWVRWRKRPTRTRFCPSPHPRCPVTGAVTMRNKRGPLLPQVRS